VYKRQTAISWSEPSTIVEQPDSKTAAAANALHNVEELNGSMFELSEKWSQGASPRITASVSAFLASAQQGFSFLCRVSC